MTALDASLFVSEQPVERTVELPDGAKHTLWFREVPAGVFQAWRLAAQSADDAVRSTAAARLIAASVCDPDGKPALPLKDAQRLKPRVTDALMKEVLSVCGFDDEGGGQKKELPDETLDGSGTS